VRDHPFTTIAEHAYRRGISSRVQDLQIISWSQLEKRFFDLPLQAAGLPPGALSFERHESGVWLTRFRQQDLLPRMRLFQQA
jgi:hypothetical protein